MTFSNFNYDKSLKVYFELSRIPFRFKTWRLEEGGTLKYILTKFLRVLHTAVVFVQKKRYLLSQ